MPPKNKKFALNSQLQIYEVLTNSDQMLILCLSYLISMCCNFKIFDIQYIPIGTIQMYKYPQIVKNYQSLCWGKTKKL